MSLLTGLISFNTHIHIDLMIYILHIHSHLSMNSNNISNIQFVEPVYIGCIICIRSVRNFGNTSYISQVDRHVHLVKYLFFAIWKE
jgi:hypothetical protein